MKRHLTCTAVLFSGLFLAHVLSFERQLLFYSFIGEWGLMAFLKRALPSFEVKNSKVTIPQERIAHTPKNTKNGILATGPFRCKPSDAGGLHFIPEMHLELNLLRSFSGL